MRKWIHLSCHFPNQEMEHYQHPEAPRISSQSLFLPSFPKVITPLIFWQHGLMCPVFERYINEIIQHIFSIWPCESHLCCCIELQFVHFHGYVMSHFVPIPQSTADGHLSCFHFLAVMKNVLINISFRAHVRAFLLYLGVNFWVVSCVYICLALVDNAR